MRKYPKVEHLMHIHIHTIERIEHKREKTKKVTKKKTHFTKDKEKAIITYKLKSFFNRSQLLTKSFLHPKLII